uniref:VWA domain-containing protein n=1 Tax=Nonomuraea bangladeshensis TaxID=404385 RepID=UPI003F497C63
MKVHRTYTDAIAQSTVVSVVVVFAGALRAVGVPVSTSETVDAVRALTQVDISHRTATRAALRATLLKDDAHDDVFDRLFGRLFPAPRREPPPDRPAKERDRPEAMHEDLIDALRRGDDDAVTATLDDAVQHWAGIEEGTGGRERHHLQRVLRRLDLNNVLQRLIRSSSERTTMQRNLDNAAAHAQLDEVMRLLEQLVRDRLHDASPAARPPAGESQDRPIMHADADELASMRATVRPLARRIATRLGRRRRGKGRIDMRKTIRDSLSSGGVPLVPRMRRRRPSKPDVVVLCDVSGSVARFAPFALSLLHALHEEFSRVRSWVFIDGIVEVTGFLESSPGVIDAHHLLGRRGLVAADGRSDYRRAFGAFLSGWPDAVTGKTTVLVIGDARSHNRAPALAETAELRRLCRRLYWFNPEPGDEWDTDDSAQALYAAHATAVFEVSTLRQLGDAVTAII